MIRTLSTMLLFFLLTASTRTVWSTGGSRGEDDNPWMMARKLADAKENVVTILTYLTENGRKWSRVGSGFLYGKEGFVVTRQNVVHNVDSMFVSLADGRKSRAWAVCHNTDYGFSVLETEESLFSSLSIGKTSDLQTSSRLSILGNSLGIFPSLTMATFLGRESNGMMRIRAEIPPGNCGSPVFNESGKLVGLLAGRLLDEKNGDVDPYIGLALGIEIISRSIDDLRQHIKKQQGWVGLSAIDLDDKTVDGVRVIAVEANGPCARVGICEGDTLVAFEGKKIGSVHQVAVSVKSKKPGDAVVFTVKKGEHLIPRQVQVCAPVRIVDKLD